MLCFSVNMLHGAGWPVWRVLLSDWLGPKMDGWPCSAAPWGPYTGLGALMARAQRPCQQFCQRAVVAAKPETQRFFRSEKQRISSSSYVRACCTILVARKWTSPRPSGRITTKLRGRRLLVTLTAQASSGALRRRAAAAVAGHSSHANPIQMHEINLPNKTKNMIKLKI